MAKSRQIILTLAATPGDSDDDGLPSMGTLREVTASLEKYNIACDTPGALVPTPRDKVSGVGLLFGPGMIFELSMLQPEVRQILVTVTDDDFGWPVLMRMCRALRWAMLDPETGRRFGG